LVSHFQTLLAGLAPVLVILAVLWKGDALLSPADRETLFRQMSQAASSAPDRPALESSLRAVLERHYSVRFGVFNLVSNVAAFTLASMLVVLAFFLIKRPAALQLGMWKQFLLQGFPVTFTVNLVAALNYASFFRSLPRRSLVSDLLLMLGEAIMRIALFTVLTALSFVAWAMTGGAFSGSPEVALESVAVTLWFGVTFQGLAGVYLYSLVFSSFPFFVLFFIRFMALSPRLRTTMSGLLHSPLLSGRPIRIAAIFFAVSVSLIMGSTLIVLGAITGSG
jgi:hypothetical protein